MIWISLYEYYLLRKAIIIRLLLPLRKYIKYFNMCNKQYHCVLNIL